MLSEGGAWLLIGGSVAWSGIKWGGKGVWKGLVYAAEGTGAGIQYVAEYTGTAPATVVIGGAAIAFVGVTAGAPLLAAVKGTFFTVQYWHTIPYIKGLIALPLAGMTQLLVVEKGVKFKVPVGNKEYLVTNKLMNIEKRGEILLTRELPQAPKIAIGPKENTIHGFWDFVVAYPSEVLGGMIIVLVSTILIFVIVYKTENPLTYSELINRSGFVTEDHSRYLPVPVGISPAENPAYVWHAAEHMPQRTLKC